jgi:hypothetical protein
MQNEEDSIDVEESAEVEESVEVEESAEVEESTEMEDSPRIRWFQWKKWQEWTNDPIIGKVILICGFLLFLLGAWMLATYNQGEGAIQWPWFNEQGEILFPWQRSTERGLDLLCEEGGLHLEDLKWLLMIRTRRESAFEDPQSHDVLSDY